MDIKQKIIEKFNKDLGSNLKNLEEIYNFQKHLKAEKDEIEKSVGIYLQSSIICNLAEYYVLITYSYQWHQPLLLQK